jgi:hypothetical protein
VSGQLATWAAEHSKATWKGRVVLVQLALAARPCGCPAGDTTRADLVRRTGLSLTTIRDGIAEVKELGEVKPLEQGGGRSRPTRYALVVALCHPDAGDCWSCSVLAEVLTKTGRHTPCFASSDDGNRAPQHRNRAPRAPTTARKQGARAARRETESQRLARLRAEQSLNEGPCVASFAADAGGAGGGEPPASTAQPGSNKAPEEKPARNGGRATRATGPLGGDGTTAEAAPLDVPGPARRWAADFAGLWRAS